MNTKKDLKKLSQEYKDIKAPKEVIIMTKNILKNENSKTKDMKRHPLFLKPLVSMVASIILMFTLLLNIVPAFAFAVNRIPIIGSVAQLLIFRNYNETGENYEYTIENAKLEGISNEELASKLNVKYESLSKELYNDFIGKLDSGIENINLLSEYSIKADNGITMSIEHSIYESIGSSYQRYIYDTIDIQNEVYITLPSLFKDESYINVISENIKSQVQKQMEADEDVSYFIEDDNFAKIDADHEFYINNNHELVLVFDQYAIAPGYMGSLEFTIPTEVINNILVSTHYIN